MCIVAGTMGANPRHMTLFNNRYYFALLYFIMCQKIVGYILLVKTLIMAGHAQLLVDFDSWWALLPGLTTSPNTYIILNHVWLCVLCWRYSNHGIMKLIFSLSHNIIKIRNNVLWDENILQSIPHIQYECEDVL